MDDYMALQALSAMNSSLQNGANMIMASQTSKQDRKFSREMSDLAYQRNIELWNMQNEYNLPVNQYARQLEGLQANGLNPNLVYGGSSSVGGAAGAVSPFKFEGYHSTAVPRFSGPDPIQSLLSTRLLQTQVQAQEAQNRLTNARASVEEARLPGVTAKSDEAAYRWNYIFNNIADTYEAGIRAQESEKYWKGVQVEYNAHYAKDRSSIEYYEAAMAEWLNTSIVPGTELTYRQYLEQYRAFMSKAQYDKVKEETLNLASQIAYRKHQGELLDLKIEYQKIVNRFANLGMNINGSWASILVAGLMKIFNAGGNKSPNAKPYEDPWLLYDIEQVENESNNGR